VISTLLILVAAGSMMTFYLTLEQIPQQITKLLAGSSTVTVLLLINVVFLVAGMFIDPNSALIVLSPLVFPAAQAAGVDPIHLGAVIVMNVAIGMITPPFGLNIFIGITTFKVPYIEVVRSVIPFIGIAILALIIVTYVPGLVMWLPRVVGF
ncbi:MAG: TRAP transporter large permease subunit, partial [Kiloniellaceae bacterium]